MHKRRIMKRIRLAAVAIAIVMTAGISKAGQITYSLQNYATDQAGSTHSGSVTTFTVTGSVTTDGKLGTLTAADIVAWTWTVSPLVGAPFTTSGVASTVSLLIATDTQLLLPVGQSFAVPSEFYLVGPDGPSSAELSYFRPSVGQGDSIYAGGSQETGGWVTDNPAMGGTNPWVIGVAAAAVPEPSGAVLMSLGIAGLLLGRTWRRFSRK
jgi:hypothetical protein